MSDLEIVLANIVALADGEVVGRVRLQKIIFLLQQQKLICSVPFRYHHYGPYSRKVDEAIDKAKALGIIREVLKQRSSDGADYSVFVSEKDHAYMKIKSENIETIKSKLHAMKKRSSTVLELAATIYWLQRIEIHHNWSDELAIRKGRKVDGGRKEQALEILNEFGLC